MEPHMVSSCCGSSPKDDLFEEIGICSECGEHCEYEKEEEHPEDGWDDDRGDNAWFHDTDMGARG